MPRPSPPPPANRGSNAGTLVAAMLLLACAGAFFLLVLLVNPFIAGILVIPMVLIPLGVFQYLIWGRWLDRLRAEQDASDAEEK